MAEATLSMREAFGTPLDEDTCVSVRHTYETGSIDLDDGWIEKNLERNCGERS